MKSLFTPGNQVATADQKKDFIHSVRTTVLWGFVFSILIDLGYYYMFLGGFPAKPGMVLWLIMNVLFALCLGLVSVLIWRNGGGGWFLLPYKGTQRNIINGLILGLILSGLVIGAVFSMLVACEGSQAMLIIDAAKELLYAQTEESAYLGIKLIGVSAGMEMTGKVEQDPPR